jgi:hypothetical protein
MVGTNHYVERVQAKDKEFSPIGALVSVGTAASSGAQPTVERAIALSRQFDGKPNEHG